MNRPLYQALASALQAKVNCRESGNTEWYHKHVERLNTLVQDHMPRGSGVDNGSYLDHEKSSPDKLVFTTSYHHMNDGGMYDGWTDHTVVVTPSLAFGISLRITGRNRNDIKDYLADLFLEALKTEVSEY